ncbi:MAG: hypothetical protein HN759_12145 [Akkermansiaceae bacterium]|jgi:hypothetical protein|nr:hypothetical protein [Akkermansiaceae bacterium]
MMKTRKLIRLAWVFTLLACTSVLMGEETKPIPGSLEGLDGLLAKMDRNLLRRGKKSEVRHGENLP